MSDSQIDARRSLLYGLRDPEQVTTLTCLCVSHIGRGGAYSRPLEAHTRGTGDLFRVANHLAERGHLVTIPPVSRPSHTTCWLFPESPHVPPSSIPRERMDHTSLPTLSLAAVSIPLDTRLPGKPLTYSPLPDLRFLATRAPPDRPQPVCARQSSTHEVRRAIAANRQRPADQGWPHPAQNTSQNSTQEEEVWEQ